MSKKRYFPPELLNSFLQTLPNTVIQEIIGKSINNLPINLVQMGSGPFKIMIWSQMHGDETTTTKALIDFIPWFLAADQKLYQKAFKLYVIPQLNPDGAKVYTRFNANKIDLNRDAIKLSQPETKALRFIYDRINPNLCLNLHGQRTIFAAGPMGATASLSFLAPSADNKRSLTKARKEAMRLIATIRDQLRDDLPNGIGRYDDSFNANCVGDSFTQMGTPTILLEAGHVSNDYQREITRKLILKTYKILLKTLNNEIKKMSVDDYFSIPENSKDFCDVILKDVLIYDKGIKKEKQELAIQYKESLRKGVVEFIPQMLNYSESIKINAHKTIILPINSKSRVIYFKKEKNIDLKEFNELLS